MFIDELNLDSHILIWSEKSPHILYFIKQLFHFIQPWGEGLHFLWSDLTVDETQFLQRVNSFLMWHALQCNLFFSIFIMIFASYRYTLIISLFHSNSSRHIPPNKACNLTIKLTLLQCKHWTQIQSLFPCNKRRNNGCFASNILALAFIVSLSSFFLHPLFCAIHIPNFLSNCILLLKMFF